MAFYEHSTLYLVLKNLLLWCKSFQAAVWSVPVLTKVLTAGLAPFPKVTLIGDGGEGRQAGRAKSWLEVPVGIQL